MTLHIMADMAGIWVLPAFGALSHRRFLCGCYPERGHCAKTTQMEHLLAFAVSNTYKLQHIERNPKVALNMDGDGQGGDIVVFTGQAGIANDALPADQVAAYAKKYQEGFARIQMSAEEFAASYSVALRITPTNLRGH